MFTSREVHRQLVFTNTGPGSSRSMSMWWYVPSLDSCAKKSGLSCLVDQASCHGCPMPCALFLILPWICGREQRNSALAVQLQDNGPFHSTAIPPKKLCLHEVMVVTLPCFLLQVSGGILSEDLSVKWLSEQLSLRQPTNKHKIWRLQENYPHKHWKGRWMAGISWLGMADK